MTKATEGINKGAFNFSTRSYPTFGRSRKPFDEANPPKTVTDSPYYWWFMFLRLNEEYKKTCQKKGKGTYSAIYKDLGNVHAMNFKEWWQARAHLFSEPLQGHRMTIAKTEDDFVSFDNPEVLNLIVPLTWSQRSLKKAFTKLVLSKVEAGKRGVSVEESNAQYRLSGKWNIEALSTAYKIYQIKNSIPKGEKKYWADIAIEARLPLSFTKLDGHNKLNSDLRRTLTIVTKRHYKRAEEFIQSSVTNSFPYGMPKVKKAPIIAKRAE